ncbi:HEAT repeat domain-containing protein [Cyanobium sp. HWJ4-Hawea]|uniref:HEAT repeat domain-containing protein n=1 Tax=Cyanobium sp. HWJ4-Hawea TaxID=2823713 RepID=UPI0020CFC511|nr:HEAT repeat domain-containing protein [Cyanobium sp. HWJ4-Hawea]MCP9808265.1 HEAT repeat domain-containing protein [Cyanobium sp. HWJ4-Hawea]
MNPQTLGAAAAVLAVLLWLSSRRRPSPLVGLDAAAVALLNRTQIELVQEAAAVAGGTASAFVAPAGARERADLLRLLQHQLQGDTGSRLAAIQAARAWGHRSTLPLLKRGLRDVSPQVAHEAARAMDLFRGSPGALASAKPQGRLPRNAALTR